DRNNGTTRDDERGRPSRPALGPGLARPAVAGFSFRRSLATCRIGRRMTIDNRGMPHLLAERLPKEISSNAGYQRRTSAIVACPDRFAAHGLQKGLDRGQRQ